MRFNILLTKSIIMEAKTLNEAWEEYDRYKTITKDEYNSISTICEHECNEQRKMDMQNALNAFCKVCNCKECSKRNVTCFEYKEFKKLLS